MYNAPHDLTCQVRQFPAEYTRHVVPYISIIWYTPDAVDTQLVDNSSTTPREVVNLENLTSSIIFPSLTASYNGEYLCKAVLSLSNGSEMVLDQRNWTLYLEGKPEVQHYVLVHTYFLVTISSHKPFRINKLTLAHTYLLVTISYTITNVFSNFYQWKRRDIHCWFSCRTKLFHPGNQHHDDSVDILIH